MFKRLIASLICITFSFTNIQYVHAQDFSVNQLPVPGTMVGESAPFAPLALKGLIVNPQKPLEFQFIVDTGKGPQDTASVKDQANQLVKYFLASLTIPEGDLWVNLSPYEKNRMVPAALGQTDLGRDLLAQDYILKQLTASLIYPEKDLGKAFWSRVYAKAQQQFGTTNIPVNTFNKVWILPDQAQVFEHVNAAYVTKSTLKVMLDEDYLALSKHTDTMKNTVILSEAKDLNRINSLRDSSATPQNDMHTLGSQIVREIVIPEITKEVNTGKNFAPLRQIYQALILAKWYKETIQNGLLDAVYTNKNKVAGVNLADPAVKEQIYERYLKAYKKGAFNYIKEDPTPDGQVIPRKYFSGGTFFGNYTVDTHGGQAMISAGVKGVLLALTISLSALIPYGPVYAQQQGNTVAEQKEVSGLIEQLKNNPNDESPVIEKFVKVGQPAVPALLEELKHGKYDYERIAAAKALGEIGDKTAIPGLIEALQIDYNDPRAAEEALGKIGQPAVPYLLKVLKYGRGFSSENAAIALGIIGDKTAVPYLLDLIDDNNAIPPQVIWALVKIGKPAIPDLVEVLKIDPKAAYGKRYKQRQVAAEALEQIRELSEMTIDEKVLYYLKSHEQDELVKLGEHAVPSLLNALRNNEGDVSVYAAITLGKIGDKNAIPALIKQDQGLDITLPDYGYRHSVYNDVLDKLGATWRDHLWGIINLSNTEEKAIINSRGLTDIGLKRYLRSQGITKFEIEDFKKRGSGIVPILISSLNYEDSITDENPDLIAEVLNFIGDKRTVNLLFDEYYKEIDQRSHERFFFSTSAPSRKVIQGLRNSVFVDDLISLLKNRDPIIKSLAASALGEIGDVRAGAPLLEVLKTTLQEDIGIKPYTVYPEPVVLSQVVRAIAKLNLIEAKPIIQKAILSNRWNDWEEGEIFNYQHYALPTRQVMAETYLKFIRQLGENLSDPVLIQRIDEVTANSVSAQSNSPQIKIYAIFHNEIKSHIGAWWAYDIDYARGKQIISLGESAIPALINASKDQDVAIRYYATIMLGSISSTNEMVIPALKDRLRDSFSPVRRVAKDALESLSWKPKTEEENIMFAIAKQDTTALLRLGSASIPYLIEDVKLQSSDIETSPNFFAIEMLDDLKAREAVPLLLETFRKNNKLHLRALDALVNIGDKDAVSDFIAQIRNSDTLGLESLIIGLGSFGVSTQEIEDVLRPYLIDYRKTVREAAEATLKKLGLNYQSPVKFIGSSPLDIEIPIATSQQQQEISGLIEEVDHMSYGLLDDKEETQHFVLAKPIRRLLRFGNIALPQILSRIQAIDPYGRTVYPNGSRYIIQRHNLVLLLGEIWPVSRLTVNALINELEHRNSVAADALARLDPLPSEAVEPLTKALRDLRLQSSAANVIVNITKSPTLIENNIDALLMAIDFLHNYNQIFTITDSINKLIPSFHEMGVLEKLAQRKEFGLAASMRIAQLRPDNKSNIERLVNYWVQIQNMDSMNMDSMASGYFFELDKRNQQISSIEDILRNNEKIETTQYLLTILNKTFENKSFFEDDNFLKENAKYILLFSKINPEAYKEYEDRIFNEKKWPFIKSGLLIAGGGGLIVLLIGAGYIAFRFNRKGEGDTAMLGGPWTLTGARDVLDNIKQYQPGKIKKAIRIVGSFGREARDIRRLQWVFFTNDIELKKEAAFALGNILQDKGTSHGVFMRASFMRTKEGMRFMQAHEQQQALLSSVRRTLWRERYRNNEPKYVEILRSATEKIFGYEHGIPIPQQLFDQRYSAAKEAFEKGTYNKAGEDFDFAMFNQTPKQTQDSTMNGGIDLNQINVLRNGRKVLMQFNPAQLIELEQSDFKGFTPVIINITHISSPFQLLGIGPTKQEVLAKV